MTDARDRELVLAALEAIERYVAASCVAVGILMLLVLEEPDDGEVAYAEYKRTPRPGAVSVGSMRRFLRDRVSGAIAWLRADPIMGFIRANAVGEGGYAPRGKGGGAEGAESSAA